MQVKSKPDVLHALSLRLIQLYSLRGPSCNQFKGLSEMLQLLLILLVRMKAGQVMLASQGLNRILSQKQQTK